MKKHLFFLLVLGLLSCGNELGIPDCINDKLSELKEEGICDTDNLTSWDFQGNVVYMFSQDKCGVTGIGRVMVFDKDCKLICEPTIEIECLGVNWNDNATNDIVIWTRY